MKRAFVISLLLAAALPSSAGKPEQSLSKISWDINKVSLEVRNGKAVATYSFTLKEDFVAKGKDVIIYPSLENGANYEPLTPFAIYRGDSRTFRNMLRNSGTHGNASGNKDERYTIAGQYHGVIEIPTVMERKEWMDSCFVYFSVMERQKSGDLQLLKRTFIGYLAKPKKPEFKYEYAMTCPEKDRSSERKVCVEMPLEFATGSTSFDIKAGRNEIAMIDFCDEVSVLMSNRYCKYRSAVLKGWTNPEGPERTNLNISRSRVQAVYNYLVKKGAVKKTTAKGMGEDWTGFVDWLRESSLSTDPGLMEILESKAGADVIEARIRAEKPRIWEILKNECFPGLSRFRLEMTFSYMDNENPKVLDAIYRKDPRLLTEWEFFRLSEKYDRGSEEWCDVFLSSAEVFPDSWTANLNAAAALLTCGHHREAVAYLNDAGDSDAANFLRAVWQYEEGGTAGAIELLRGMKDSENLSYRSALASLISIKNWEDDCVLWIYKSNLH